MAFRVDSDVQDEMEPLDASQEPNLEEFEFTLDDSLMRDSVSSPQHQLQRIFADSRSSQDLNSILMDDASLLSMDDCSSLHGSLRGLGLSCGSMSDSNSLSDRGGLNSSSNSRRNTSRRQSKNEMSRSAATITIPQQQRQEVLLDSTPRKPLSAFESAMDRSVSHTQVLQESLNLLNTQQSSNHPNHGGVSNEYTHALFNLAESMKRSEASRRHLIWQRKVILENEEQQRRLSLQGQQQGDTMMQLQGNAARFPIQQTNHSPVPSQQQMNGQINQQQMPQLSNMQSPTVQQIQQQQMLQTAQQNMSVVPSHQLQSATAQQQQIQYQVPVVAHQRLRNMQNPKLQASMFANAIQQQLQQEQQSDLVTLVALNLLQSNPQTVIQTNDVGNAIQIQHNCASQPLALQSSNRVLASARNGLAGLQQQQHAAGGINNPLQTSGCGLPRLRNQPRLHNPVWQSQMQHPASGRHNLEALFGKPRSNFARGQQNKP